MNVRKQVSFSQSTTTTTFLAMLEEAYVEFYNVSSDGAHSLVCREVELMLSKRSHCVVDVLAVVLVYLVHSDIDLAWGRGKKRESYELRRY